ncbi:hypothetical protein VM1G_04581 [Cytospora mali]|uniref:Uncharacterized protein n=1 Tax=Cytospora mali TaxID=578113 RepID=A0A194VYN9_CYTMA|nr:hypothetical protein VM1G_04581 [Valsa mali]
MPAKYTKRSRLIALDSDDDMAGSASHPVHVMDSDDETLAPVKALAPAAPAPGLWPPETDEEYNAFLSETVKLYAEDGDADVDPELENIGEVMEEEDNEWVEGDRNPLCLTTPTGRR